MVVDVARGVALPRLRRVRLAKFFTQAELAQRAGVSLATVVRLEKGSSPAEIPTVRRLAEALGVEPGALAEPETSGPA